jgi:hypothetical protein
MRTVGVLALAVAALALAADASAARRNPCELVTAADAKAALGGAAGRGTQSSARLFDVCTYVKGKRTLTVKSREITRAGFDRAARHIPGTSLGVPGLGAVAWVYFVPDGVSLALWKGGTEVVVAVKGAGAGASPIVRQAAQAAAGRL